MPVKYTQEEVIAKFIEIHKDKYNYDKAVYKGYRKPITITCPKHGDFEQLVQSHLKGHGCKECSDYDNRKKIGSKSSLVNIKDNQKAYHTWISMQQRCYEMVDGKRKYPAYEGVEVCDEWRYSFENFLKWHNENYKDGWQLDKDLLSPISQTSYSPQTCCYLPKEINTSLRKIKPNFIILPNGKYRVQLEIGEKKGVHLGCFKTYKEALAVYIEARTQRLTELANKYKDQLSDRVYNALLDFYNKRRAIWETYDNALS